MKHLRVLLAAVVITAASLSVQSCKKGEEDPFLSFKSRDARLAGEWVLTEILGQTTQTSVSGSTTSITKQDVKYANGVQTTTVTSSGGTTSSTKKFNFNMSLQKDGNCSSKTDNFDQSGALTSSTEGEGTWQWLSDGKNKSNIYILENNSYINGITEVLGLKNKMLKVRKHSRTKSASGSNSFEQVTETTYTFEAE